MTKTFKYGVSLYSYTDDFGTVMTLEDAFFHVADLGATGIEILGEAHVPAYPEPSSVWLDTWFGLLERYKLEPTNYGCWLDTRLTLSRKMTVAQGVADLTRDLQLAARLGFKFVRPKIGVVSQDLVPDPIWDETIERVLDLAHKLDIIICPEIHSPTPIRHPVVEGYIDFIQRTGTSNFGLLIDTGIFQDRPLPYWPGETEEMRKTAMSFLDGIRVPVQDLIDIIDHVVFIQAKFHHVNDLLEDEHIPWKAIVPALKQAGYTGYLSSEYEGVRDPWASIEQVRRQHALIRKLEREYDAQATKEGNRIDA